jgi:O-antigen/teichoic acid export membrane protein
MTARTPARPATPGVEHEAIRRGSSLLSDATLGTLGAVGGTVISGIASIIIARGLGVTARGRWAVISSLAVLIATIASVGFPAAAAYAAARVQSAARPQIIRSSLTGAGVLGMLAALVYLAVAAVIRPPASSLAVGLGCVIPLATLWYAVAHQLTLTVASMRSFAWAQLINAVVTLVAVLALSAANSLTVFSVVLVSAGGSLTGAAVSVAALRGGGELARSWVSRPALALRVMRPYLPYALVTFATLSLTQVVQRVDVLLVNGFKGPHAAGLYAVAAQITDLMLVVPAALGLVVFRRGARSVPAHYEDALIVLRWTGAFAVAAAVFALVIAPWIVLLVFGSGYHGSVAPLRLLLPGTVAFSLQSVLSQYLAGRGRPRVVLVAWTVGAIVGVGADVFVIPTYGIDGAAVVSSASYALVTGLHFKALRAARSAPSE